MTDDLVKRLRAPAYWVSSDLGYNNKNPAPFSAADRIEALEAEVERLECELSDMEADLADAKGAYDD